MYMKNKWLKNSNRQHLRYSMRQASGIALALVMGISVAAAGHTQSVKAAVDTQTADTGVVTTTDTAKLDTVITKAIEDRDAEKREKGIPEKSKEQQLEDLLAKKPIQTEETSKVNFNMAKTEKNPLSEPSSTTFKMQEGVSNGKKKPSVKKELAELKVEAKKLDEQKSKEKVKVNIAPVQNNKKAKAKSSR
jgi:hypothetical protein